MATPASTSLAERKFASRSASIRMAICHNHALDDDNDSDEEDIDSYFKKLVMVYRN